MVNEKLPSEKGNGGDRLHSSASRTLVDANISRYLTRDVAESSDNLRRNWEF